jgi:acyl-CoA hydrolase
MEPETFITHHLVRSEDLNHHGTLFAGRSSEWFIEAGFIATAGCIPPENIVCRNVHGMTFARPVNLGEIIRFESKVIDAGRTHLVALIHMLGKDGDEIVRGFITFVSVDKEAKPFAHGIVITPASPEDIALQEAARAL